MLIWIALLSFILGYAVGAVCIAAAMHRTMVPTLSLRGWFCTCGIFNGEEKEKLIACRTCSKDREWALKHQPQNLTRIAFLGDKKVIVREQT